MAKKTTTTSTDPENSIIQELMQHYQAWTEDNQKRMTRKNGWNDVTDAYWGKLPDGWPYMSKTVDPRISTSIIEKDARLLNKKPKGRVTPRDGDTDIIKAEIQNCLLSFQWDSANFGGSMQEKLLISSQDTRLYASKFALVYWREALNDKDECTFSGNELMPLDIRDCGMDWNATHIRDAKWFQVRQWKFIEDMEMENEMYDKPIWKNLDVIKGKMKSARFKASDIKENAYPSRILQNQGLTQRVGRDSAFPMLEVVTEYREGHWYSFTPRYKEVCRDIDNPYDHGKIPISQLRYHPIQDDPLGESEVERVISIWKAIQACVCGYLDEMILKQRPPLKIVANQVQIETIVYGPEAQWLVDRADAVTEMAGSGEAQRWFQTTYPALVSAFNTAMGDMSQGVSNVDSLGGDKTATEIRQGVKQQNARDQRNQNELSDFIRDIVLMWIANNKQFLFSSKDKKVQQYILKIVGQSEFAKLKAAGLADFDVPSESMQMIGDTMEMNNYDVSDEELNSMVNAAQIPQFPVFENPEEKDPEKLKVRPKMEIDDYGESANLVLIPDDMDGNFDYIVDVKSMELGSSVEYINNRQQAITMVKDPLMLQMLAQEGWKPKVKDLLVSIMNEGGLNDSQKYFERVTQNPSVPGGNPQVPGVVPNSPNPGVPAVPQTVTQPSLDQQMAQPSGFQIGG
jgi:hypothetical protein